MPASRSAAPVARVLKPGRCTWSGREGHLVPSAARPLLGCAGSAVHMLPTLLPQIRAYPVPPCDSPATHRTIRLQLDSTHHEK